MFHPSFEEFSRYTAGHTLVPVAKRILADLLTPVSAFMAVAEKQPYAFLLESVEGGERIGRYTFLGVSPRLVFTARGNELEYLRGKKRERKKGALFPAVRELFASHKSASIPGLPPLAAGAVGYFAYDAVRQLEKLPRKAKDDLKLPDCVLMFFDRLIAFDHVKHELLLVAAADVRAHTAREAYDAAVANIEELESTLRKRLAKAAGLPTAARGKNAPPVVPHPRTEQKRFLKDVQKVKEYIAAGDVFQAVLSQRFELETRVAPFDIYRALRRVNPSPYMYFLCMGGLQVAGSSPEMLVKCTNSASGQRLEYRPIAGTRPRGKSEAEDLQLEAELRADQKERAEHVMLVDLGRNDLGRVSETGSVKVRELMTIERYSHVMHIVSALESKLREGLTPFDAFAACFPAGTLTGAPKVRAMEIIEELEPVRRGVYGGSVLYADFAGNLDSCIAIRTLVMQGRRAWVQAGAGIVADSDPQREYEECLNKAKAVVRAVEEAS